MVINAQLTADSFERQSLLLLEEWIRGKIGISYQGHRLSLLSMRIKPRIEALGLENYTDYFRYLQFNPNKGEELKTLISRLTNNETFFFREQAQLDALATHVIPDMLGRYQTLRIAHAGCSSGEEPLSLAATWYKQAPHYLDRVQFFGIDIDLDILARARNARYTDNSFRGVDPLLIHRYFETDGSVRTPKPFLRDKVLYRWGNLFDNATLGARESYDIILCRNVMIYFEEDGRKLVADNLYDRLKPGGVFIVGLSETLSSISYRFEPRRFGSVVFYQKERG